MATTVFINFRGGIIDAAKLHQVMKAAQKVKVLNVRFGLRQQLLIDMEDYSVTDFSADIGKLDIPYEIDANQFPNIISSYPAEDVFIKDTWLTENIYKEVLNTFDYRPAIKINICDTNQSFTPMLTGNINWIADPSNTGFWYLFIRFPKTNVVYEWHMLTPTNSISRISKSLEEIITSNPARFIDNPAAEGEQLFAMLQGGNEGLMTAVTKAVLPQFNLPYYEGLNRYGDKYWLGIYRRDELFSVAFLKSLSRLCMDTKLTQLCCTSWKSIMIKGIEEKDKETWNLLLEEFQINMRHAANELNFQVEDNSAEGLALKNYLVKHLSIDDTRTFGICIGIKTRKKSEIFSSILVRRRFLIDLLGIRLLPVYDILCAKDFNPNERTEEVFSSGNPRAVLPEQLRRSVLKYYHYRADLNKKESGADLIFKQVLAKRAAEYVYQCSNCMNVYDPVKGDSENGIPAGTPFENLTTAYSCTLCDADKASFKKVKRESIKL